MAAHFMLDTDIVSYIRKRHLPQVRVRFERLKAGEAVLSVVTYGELLYGALRSQNRDKAILQLEELTAMLPVLALESESSQHYGEIRAELAARGEIIGNNDLWIAAHARSQGLILVTNNEREFKRVRGLKIENWAK